MASAPSQPNRRSGGRSEKTSAASPQASTRAVRMSAGPMRTVACSTAIAGSSSPRLLCVMRLRKWMVAPERDRQRDDAGKLQPVAEDPEQGARGDDREDSRRQAGESDPGRAERKPDESGDEDELDGQGPVELVDHAGAVARSDHGESSHGDPVAWVSLAHG